MAPKMMTSHGILLFSVIASMVSFSVLALSPEVRQLVLDQHNQLRSSLAKGQAKNSDGSAMPEAANMLQLAYSEECEQFAQKWVERCEFKHSRGPYGENLWAGGAGVSDADALKGAIASAWWNELKNKGFNDPDLKLNEQNWEPIGHWTQEAWAQTGQVGCAVKRCPSMTIASCNYKEPGNYMGEPVYKKGKACSACSDYPGATCNSANGLCVIGGGNQASTPSTTSSTTTQKPSTATKKPTTITLKPSTTTKKPSTVTQKQSTTTKKASTVTLKPSTTTKKASPTTLKQIITTKKPVITTQKPSTTTKITTKTPTTMTTTTTTITPCPYENSDEEDGDDSDEE